MEPVKTLKIFLAVFFCNIISNHVVAQQLCESVLIGTIPFYEGYASCQAYRDWGQNPGWETIGEWVPATLETTVWVHEYLSNPYPGGWLSCWANVPYAGLLPIYDDDCQHLTDFSYNHSDDSGSGVLYDTENSTILDSWNLDDSALFNVSWSNPGNFSVRVEYKIDYRADPYNSPLPDIGWTHLVTWPQGSTGGNLPLSRYYEFPSYPDHYEWVGASRYDNYTTATYWRTAVTYYRFRLESASQTGDWQYMRPIWVYERS